MAGPRILCLHGGGTNANIFRAQCRALESILSPSTTKLSPGQDRPARFRLVYVDAPFMSAPHPDIISVYGSEGPFRRWLRWKTDHADCDGLTTAKLIMDALRGAMADDDAKLERDGETAGEWVGIMGFSQGAKIAMSVLWAQEHLADPAFPMEIPWLNAKFRFGVIIAGRAPIIDLGTGTPRVRGIGDPAELTLDFENWPQDGETAHMLHSIPTVHVHGSKDPGMPHHQKLFKEYCAPGTATLVEWGGGHRLPFASSDIMMIAERIFEAARQLGMFWQ